MRNAVLSAVIAVGFALPCAAQAEGFNGFRIEGRTGYDNNSGGGVSAGGILGGVGIGYDAEIGKGIVAGVEADLDFASTKYLVDLGSAAGSINAQRDIEASVRVGFKAASSTLIYVKGGYSNGAYKVQAEGVGFSVSESAKADGYRLGAGVEQLLGKHGYVKAEYRYTNYSSAEIKRNQLVLAAGWRF
jgi:outer membrane immunogenic protein